MVTTKIEIKKHLAEYVHGKYNDCMPGPVFLPDREDLYHVVYDLLEKRPVSCLPDSGNLELGIPDRRIGKSPDTYNYLGARSCRIISQKIEVLFWAELHSLIDENKHLYGIQYIETVAYFMRKYGIQSITEDALLKNYYRWRDKVRKKSKRRGYAKQ
ncbi:hypothetical protein M1P97_19880 [Parabacteroides sp. GYB001]|uniref:hypothetical protein n=1 Tax=Parabacteroides leei TaxID=2939491 RepID=UPI00201731A1|nr:hypothetical protein [Parabacteroides leei]MCL3853546.1 hypothetical protein [Parabacteroides leei]